MRGRWTSYLSLVGNLAGPVAMAISFLIIPNFGWRVMFIIGGVSAILVWIVRHGLPESPRWYESQGQYDKAEAILTEVEHGIEQQKGITLQMPEVEEAVIGDKAENVSWTELFKGAMLGRFIVASACLIAMNTLIYTIVNWLPTIFVREGISVVKSVGMTAIMMLGAPLGVFVSSQLTDRFPRKYLAVSLLFLIAVVSVIYSVQRDEIYIMFMGFLMTILIYYYVCFSCSVYVPELFPTSIRLRGMGAANAVGRLSAVFSPYGVAWLLTNYGTLAVFEALAVFILLIAALIFVMGVETRYKSLE